MSKLSFEALQQKAAKTNQQELLSSVSGGTFGDCHCNWEPPGEANSSQGWQRTLSHLAHIIGINDCEVH